MGAAPGTVTLMNSGTGPMILVPADILGDFARNVTFRGLEFGLLVLTARISS